MDNSERLQTNPITNAGTAKSLFAYALKADISALAVKFRFLPVPNIKRWAGRRSSNTKQGLNEW